MKKYIVIDDYGRTPNVCKNILKIISDLTIIKEVSVMMNFVDNNFHKKLKLTKTHTSLHINLTDNIVFKKINNRNLSFLNLLFLSREKRKYIYDEIDKQINSYINIYDLRKIDINSHQHVHAIPWIYSYLLKNNKINKIRYSNEKIIFAFNNMNIFKFIRNVIALVVLKILNLFNKKKTNNKFFGILFTNNMNPKIIKHILYYNKCSNLHILLHPGRALKNEKNFFLNNNFYKYFISENRKKEMKALYRHNENINNN